MEPLAIIAELTRPRGLPRAALAAASERREDMVPLFIAEIERYIAADAKERTEPDALFFMFHLLGEWRETAAYPVLARFLRMPSKEMERILDDAITITTHRIMAAVFDGDPQPLYDIIHDADADEFIRSRMIETLGMLVAQGRLERAVVVDFLREGFASLQPQDTCFIWDGWQNTIAMLGLEELSPLVEQAFQREYVDPQVCDYAWHQGRLSGSLATPGGNDWPGDEYKPFGNTIEEFAQWHGFSEAYRRELERTRQNTSPWPDFAGPALNPHRDVGRNDPCPCGSGIKFKKCCLNELQAAADLAA